ncbi:MAG TPA: hypothetical protein VFE42_15370 [Chloroflexota bacterium]|nr:hypothetical protein [Chloroflexota bacterium]
MGLDLDEQAMRELANHRTGQALVVTVSYTRGHWGPTGMLTARWCRLGDAARDPGLVFQCVREGVPVYLHRRVAAYVRWHLVRLRAVTLAWWRFLVVERELEVWYNLMEWEHAHPGLSGRP